MGRDSWAKVTGTITAAALLSISGDAAAKPRKGVEITLEQGIRDCTNAARARDPALELHGIGQYVARGGRVIGVAITLPGATELVTCLESLPARGARLPESHSAERESVAVGGFAVDLGGLRPPQAAGGVVSLFSARRAELKGLVEKLVASGLLDSKDALVRELRASSAPKVP